MRNVDPLKFAEVTIGHGALFIAGQPMGFLKDPVSFFGNPTPGRAKAIVAAREWEKFLEADNLRRKPPEKRTLIPQWHHIEALLRKIPWKLPFLFLAVMALTALDWRTGMYVVAGWALGCLSLLLLGLQPRQRLRDSLSDSDYLGYRADIRDIHKSFAIPPELLAGRAE